MSKQKTHAELIAEQLTNIESLGDELPAVIVAGSLRKLLRHLDEAHNREVDALNEQITELRQQRDLWSKRAAELVEKCNEQYAKLKQVGNAAKLREAVVEVQGCANGALMAISHENVPIQHMWDIIDVCKVAIAAPPRNCDVGTVKEQLVRYTKFCYAHRSYENGCGGCPLNGEPCCELAWAQMPYEEGDGR